MSGKLRRLCYSVLMIVLVALSFSMSAHAADTNAAVVVKRTGKQAYLYYKSNNEKVTGLTGLQELPRKSGNFYYFKNNKGRIYCNCTFKTSKGSYRVLKTGRLVTGWYKKTKKKIYYYDPKTCLMAKGWKTINKKTYYFKKNGLMATGFTTVGNYKYYLDPSTGVRQTGLKKISGKYYYFDTKGRMQKGLVTINKKVYYFDNNGVRKTGLITYNGSTYYFNTSSGVMVTGWKTVSGKTYYFRGSGKNKGKAVTGWMTLSKKKYYFNTSGVMQKGWLTIGSRKYYMNTKTGAMTTGTATISGKTYNFGTKGYITEDDTSGVTGAYSIKVNQNTNVVTIYRGSTAVKAMRCSVGMYGATPDGTFYIGDKLRWHYLYGGVAGQYCEHLVTVKGTTWSDYLFHSVPYYTYGNKYSLETEEYRKLGTAASAGCVRLACGDAYYIYKNVPIGTQVTIFHGSASDDPLGKPALVQPNWTGNYDPTDPEI